jgi:hypothetical protein
MVWLDLLGYENFNGLIVIADGADRSSRRRRHGWPQLCEGTGQGTPEGAGLKVAVSSDSLRRQAAPAARPMLSSANAPYPPRS